MISRDVVEAELSRWIERAARGRRARVGRALRVGVSGPQGSGKSTLCARLCTRLEAAGLRAFSLSIDDVYLPRDAQRALAAARPANGYLAARGYPGTHDVSLGESLLDRLSTAGPGERVAVPAYDKGAHGGAGDRAPREAWPVAEGPLDVLLFEGWMLAFSPVERGECAGDDALAEVNDALRAYEGWRARMDRWILLQGERVEHVLDWRVDAERARRERDGRGMTDAQALEYVSKFLPAYRLWGSRIALSAPARKLVLARDRGVLSLSDPSP